MTDNTNNINLYKSGIQPKPVLFTDSFTVFYSFVCFLRQEENKQN